MPALTIKSSKQKKSEDEKRTLLSSQRKWRVCTMEMPHAKTTAIHNEKV
jgi:hypothetical protein